MRSVTAVAYARAGLLGNPSDIYGGRVLAFTFRDFSASVTLEAAERVSVGVVGVESLRAVAAPGFAARVPGGAALLAAAIKRLTGHVPRVLDDACSRLRIDFASDIPRQVGLGGSSAIVVAALRALADWFGIALDASTLADLALAAETEELGITAGPMDRVVQAHEGFLHMDFRPPRSYRALDPSLLPPLFVAWDPRPGEDSGAVHDRVRPRWERGEPEVVAALESLARMADEGLEALRRHDVTRFRRLVDESFEVRASVWEVRPRDRAMVTIGRRGGAAVKLCGSGGAVVGALRDEAEYAALAAAYREAGYDILRPRIRA